MDTVTLQIRKPESGPPIMHADRFVLCGQYDHLSVCLMLRRPEEYADALALLLFSDGETHYPAVHLGTTNEFAISSEYTHCGELHVEAVFFRNGQEIAHTNDVAFNLRPSLGPVGEGYFEDDTLVAEHDADADAHENMMIDGNALAAAFTGSSLAAHQSDPNAHQNLIIDGNR